MWNSYSRFKFSEMLRTDKSGHQSLHFLISDYMTFSSSHPSPSRGMRTFSMRTLVNGGDG